MTPPCDIATVNVEVEDDEKQLRIEQGVNRTVFVLQRLGPWVV